MGDFQVEKELTLDRDREAFWGILPDCDVRAARIDQGDKRFGGPNRRERTSNRAREIGDEGADLARQVRRIR